MWAGAGPSVLPGPKIVVWKPKRYLDLRSLSNCADLGRVLVPKWQFSLPGASGP